MWINLRNGVVFDVLPETTSPVLGLTVPLTPDNAQEHQYIHVYDYFNQKLESVIESCAKAKGYKSAESFRSYAGEQNAFQAEARQFIRYCAGLYTFAQAEYQKILSGELVLATSDDIDLSQLPKFEDFA